MESLLCDEEFALRPKRDGPVEYFFTRNFLSPL